MAKKREEETERVRAETRKRLARYDASDEHIPTRTCRRGSRRGGTPTELHPPTRIRKVRTR